jgi:hypothetical protein
LTNVYPAASGDEERVNSMAYLQCPDCRLTVPAASYYLRGDQCPRCLTAMEKRERFRGESASAGAVAAATEPSATAPA